MLCEPVELAPFKAGAEHEVVLKTDASAEALGAVLSQRGRNGLEPIMIVSRALTDSEKAYGNTERELLAVA